ncbi:MAG: amidophosphoribosyltransferase [Bacteroides sp. SM23_62_1]|nr:MAG: amidophosphoribosyltransferase [Bacteroides sp. SM23_62_1]
MSDRINHECGIALIRLLQPLEYYQYKYGSWRYGLNKLYLLMEKQHNRGQDGAGIACISFDIPPGEKYLHRYRSANESALNDVFGKISAEIRKVERKSPELVNNPNWAKENLSFAGEVYLGHLRYGTFGKNGVTNVHPVWRQNNWQSRNLVIAGNFNLTNVDELFQILIELGQHPKDFSDTVTILEKIGHFLDQENQRLFTEFKNKGHSNQEISELIARDLDVAGILRESSKRWDGGFVIAGLIGHGDAFVYRDPHGIRPAYYYQDEEVVVVTSERPVIQTAMNTDYENIKEVEPGHALVIKRDGRVTMDQVLGPYEKKACSFERIYFSRGTDRDIYQERKKLGELLTDDILKAVDYDLDHTVFSYIPNTAESAFYGMIGSIERYMNKEKEKIILERGKDLSEDEIREIVNKRPRVEKIAVKDIKLRTFISKDEGRDDLVGHVYDITYGTIRKKVDNLVVIDDSIVRGTTLRQSILRILDRLEPKRIVIVSSSPQIRYPDCYGIDMAKLSDFIAFQAAISLLKETGQEQMINKVYNKAKEQIALPKEEVINYVKMIYESFTYEQVSDKVGELLRSKNIRAEVRIVYQTVENLHRACPNHKGDWYFTGDYPTPGGNKVANRSFINYIEGRNERAY